jgi:hypothetical protein
MSIPAATDRRQSQADIADELHPIIENVLDELDGYLGFPLPSRRVRLSH